MIFVTGDTHGNWYGRFNTNAFPEQKEMGRDDFVIVCGDFGIWHDNEDERERLSFLEKRPFTILFCDGNHENFDRLYSDEFEIVDFHGGKAHRIRDNIYHLMRGYIFDLEGKRFFVFGGARSHDIRDGIVSPADFSSYEEMMEECRKMQANGLEFRIEHYSWWPQEFPSDEEMKFGLKTLEDADYDVDYVITHCAPQTIEAIIMHGGDRNKFTVYLQGIADKAGHAKWFFGHYHDNKRIFGDYYLLYEQIVRIT